MVMERVKVSSKNIPTGVKISSVVYFIKAILLVLIPILIFVRAATIFGDLETFFGGLLAIVLLIIGIPFSILFIIAAIKLRKGSNGWRIFAIIFSIIGFILGIFNLSLGGWFGIVHVIINGYVVGYLLFSKEAKHFFHVK